MYYLAKFIQASGLILIFIDFIRKFPNLMSPKILCAGILMCFAGWIMTRYLLKQ